MKFWSEKLTNVQDSTLYLILYHFYAQNFVSLADGSWVLKEFQLESHQKFHLQKQPASIKVIFF